MRRLSISGAFACGGALTLFPLAFSPSHPSTPWLAVAALVSLGGASITRSHALVGTTGALVVIEYALALTTATLDAFAAVAGVGLLLLLELLDSVVSPSDVIVERSVLRRRALWAGAVALAGGALALVAQALGGVVDARHPLLFAVAAACVIGVLALVASLTLGAVTERRSDADRPA